MGYDVFCHLEFHRDDSKAPEDVIPKLLGPNMEENPETPENAKPLISVVVVDLQGRLLRL